MKLLVCLLIVTSSVISTFAFLNFGVTRLWRCPRVESQSTFDLKRYLGLWYEIQRFPAPFEKGQCNTAQYSLKDNGKVNVLNSEIRDDGKVHTATAEATVKDSNKPAVLSVKFPSNPIAGEYRVVETDYDNYSLVTSCTSIVGLAHVEFAWILSRDFTLSQSTVDRLKAKLEKAGFRTSEFQATEQAKCRQ